MTYYVGYQGHILSYQMTLYDKVKITAARQTKPKVQVFGSSPCINIGNKEITNMFIALCVLGAER